MPTLQDIQARTIGQVNSLTTALKLSKDDFISEDFSVTVNPIELLVSLFKSLKGYDWLVENISKFIVYVLPGLEWTVKGLLLTNLQAMLSCSVNPIITRKTILEGTVFDVKKIDLLNIFKYSPLDTNPTAKSVDAKRNYYYFGCTREDGVMYIDDLKFARDFNAVLWYAKNTPNERIVWRRQKDMGKDLQLKNIVSGTGLTWYKQPKSNGIVTIEYNVNSDELTNSEHSGMNLQEPMEDCMHVYIGCNIPMYPTEVEESKNDISDKTRKIAAYDALIEELEELQGVVTTTYLEEHQETTNNLDDPLAEKYLTSKYKEEKSAIEFIKKTIRTASRTTTLVTELANDMTVEADGSLSRFFTLGGPNGTNFLIDNELASSTRKREIADKVEIQRDIYISGEYPSATSNYYYLHPLIEFNTDFVFSMNPLFDAKVVTAQLIDALTGMFSYSNDFGQITIQTQFIQAQIREIVEKIINRDTAIINDCFFSFTNETYNDMLQQVELSRVGMNAGSGGAPYNIPSADDIMESLNSLSPDATKEEIRSAIEGTIYSAVSSANPHGAGEWSVTADMNGDMLTNLLMKLVYVIVTTIVSPKIYVLIMMNLKIMEEDASFDLQKFISQFKDMIVELIQSVKNAILDWFIEQLNTLIKELASQLATRLVLEQYQYYIDLLKRCISCIKIHGKQYDWVMDDVDYADITEITEYTSEEC